MIQLTFCTYNSGIAHTCNSSSRTIIIMIGGTGEILHLVIANCIVNRVACLNSDTIKNTEKIDIL